MLGTPAPVFPGFEIDITTPVPDGEKPDAVWHNTRVKNMLKDHPEIRDLIGNHPATALWCLAFVGVQLGMAFIAAGQPWWVILIAAYIIGAWANVNLFMLGHECNHGLVFKRTTWNRWLYTLTTMPMFLSAHHAWWIEHHTHHNDLGAKKDFIKRRRTFFLMTRRESPLLIPFALIMLITQAIRSTIGLISYLTDLCRFRLTPGATTLSILADEHLVSGYHKYRFPRWAVVYAVLSLALPIGLYCWLGWGPVLYLIASATFMTGFMHPLMFGMILSNSHFHGAKIYQPSSSYYGWYNKLTFNFGLHTEHHDIASIPWNRLPALRKLAPEYYDPLHKTTSYIGLAMLFVFGPKEQFADIFANEELRNSEMLGTTDPMAPVSP